MEDCSRFDRCRWVGCHAECVDEIEMCWYHYSIIGQTFIEHRSIFGSKFRTADQEATRERERAERQHRRANGLLTRQEKLQAQSVVYYVRIHDHVKIGFTVNLRQRLSGLRVDDDALLATEPGGRPEEAARHKQFAAERVGKRENFNPSRRLLSHIEAIRAEHGDPVITTYPRLTA